ncbi:MAG TPA: type VI secretion system lipoprotein TssJ [Steroidobacteraceae bacterium]|nr:type VI secretion system lipoprotein TssJ [Steroidobacteraceae bacterium]
MPTRRCAAYGAPGVAIVLASLGLVLAGCHSAPPKPVPERATLSVAPNVNPDSSGRPSPVVVRIYQLKDEGAFNNADYFALMDKEQETLGPTLVEREEYELQPGETRVLELNVAPEARYLGAIAGFRDIRNAHWKALSPTPEKSLKDLIRTKKLIISFGKAEVKITAG